MLFYLTYRRPGEEGIKYKVVRPRVDRAGGEEGIKYKVVRPRVDRAGRRRVLNIKWSGPGWTGPGGGGY